MAAVGFESDGALAGSLYFGDRVGQVGRMAEGVSDLKIAERLLRWKVLTSGVVSEGFGRRLGWLGLDEVSVRPLLGGAVLPDDVEVPPWGGWLLASLAECKALIGDGGLVEHDFFDPENPVQFEHVLAPFVVAARKRIVSDLGVSAGLLSEKAWVGVQRHWSRELAFFVGRLLAREFDSFRYGRMSSVDRFLSRVSREPLRVLYEGFVTDLLGDGFGSFFGRYPVAARLIGTRMLFWGQHLSELVGRLESDESLLSEAFCEGEPTGEIDDVSMGVGDGHNQGRSVAILTFSSGTKVVYKPKDLGIDQAFANLVGWLNERQGDAGLHLESIDVVVRDGYGWCEFVEHEGCGSEQELSDYFVRAGVLLALVHFLGGNDCHFENVIARGAYPFLVDLETIMSPTSVQLVSDADSTLTAMDEFSDSVLSTGFLPGWMVLPGGGAFDLSGFGAGAEIAGGPSLGWSRVNTDGMAFEKIERSESKPMASRPFLSGETDDSPNAAQFDVADFEAEISAGYSATYDVLLANRDVLLAEGGPLRQFRGLIIRFILRATRVYFRLLMESLAPGLCGDAIDRSIQLDRLAIAYVGSDDKPVTWPLCGSEFDSLRDGDIPFFTTTTDSLAVSALGLPDVEGALSESAWSRLERSVTRLSVEDRARQLAFLRASFQSKSVTSSMARTAPAGNPVGAGVDAVFDPDRLLSDVNGIAKDLSSQAVRGDDGSASWIGLNYQVDADVFSLQPLDAYSLYSGAMGPALFFAAAGRVAGDSGYLDLSRAALQPVLVSLRREAEQTVRLLPVGAMTGFGSVIYTFAALSALLDDASLLDSVSDWVQYLSPEVIAKDDSLDVISGACGLILALGYLIETRPSAVARQVIGSCGDHLIGRAERDGDVAFWKGPAGPGLCGMSHGNAGISLALLKAWKVTGRQEFLDTAVAGLTYERKLFDATENNWPDLRSEPAGSDAESQFMSSWCHGAPGIGLARAEMLRITELPGLSDEIDHAIENLQATNLQSQHLCCGEGGLADIELELGTQLDRPDLIEHSQARIMRILTSSQEAGGYQLNHLPIGANVPGLMQGTTGIGYALLRQLDPTLPNVLALS